MTDYKELCAELVTELEGWCGTGTYDNTVNAHSVIDRARAALAQSVEEGPSDEEIMELMPQQMRDDLAAQWGADQELEACCEWLDRNTGRWDLLAELRAARRPKPPGLKDRALAALNVIEDKMLGPTTEEKLIRLALEALPND
jgi:hypothetical protein